MGGFYVGSSHHEHSGTVRLQAPSVFRPRGGPLLSPENKKPLMESLKKKQLLNTHVRVQGNVIQCSSWVSFWHWDKKNRVLKEPQHLDQTHILTLQRETEFHSNPSQELKAMLIQFIKSGSFNHLLLLKSKHKFALGPNGIVHQCFKAGGCG